MSLSARKLWQSIHTKHSSMTLDRHLFLHKVQVARIFKCKNKANQIYAHTFTTNIHVAASCPNHDQGKFTKMPIFMTDYQIAWNGSSIALFELVQRDRRPRSACLFIERNKQTNYAHCLWHPNMQKPCPITNHLNKFSLPHFRFNHNYYF